MFTTANKTSLVPVVQQKTQGNSFFKKAGEDTFFTTRQNTFFGTAIQAKLTVSEPNDPQEKEADDVAAKVMRMPDAVVQTAAVGGGDNEEKIHPKNELNAPAVIHRKIQVGGQVASQVIATKELGHPDAFSEPNRSEKERVSRKISLHQSDILRQSGRGPPGTSPSFEQTLASTKGAGSAMPGDTQQFMESRFNADFSSVRIHTGSTAEALTSNVQAQAFAHGSDIYFNSGKYAPGSTAGKTLLAHELTHTIQQGAGTSTASPKHKISTKRQEGSFNPPSNAISRISDYAQSTGSNNKEAEQVQAKTTSEIATSKPATASPTSPGNLSIINQAQQVAALKGGTPEKDFQKKEENRREEEPSQIAKDYSPQKKPALLRSAIQLQSVSASTDTAPLKISKNDNGRSINPLNEVDHPTTNTITKDRGPPVSTKVNGTGALVQRSLIDGAMSRSSEVLTLPGLSDLTDPKGWLLGKVRQFASYIPGYRALGVVLGHDPITGSEIPQNGRNFIEAALDIIPGGILIKQKLEELGLIDQAAAWIDTQVATLAGIVAGVRNEFTQAWDGISATSILDGPVAVVRSVGGILERAVTKVIDFARRAATELVNTIKRFLLTHVVIFVKEHTNAYELLKVIMGKDPITDERVARNGTTILSALLELGGEAGREQRRQMQETHTFEKAAAWIDRGIAVFGDLYDAIRNGFNAIWDVVSIDALMHPVDTFNRIYEKFAGPVGRVLAFVTDTLKIILGFIKEALMARLSAWAKTIRGYSLVTVIIGKDPFTNAGVPRTVENIIRGFMSLMDGGEEQFAQLQQSGAIGRAAQRINAAVGRLNMTPAFIVQLFTQLWESFGFADLTRPQEAFGRIMAKFGEPIGRLISFVVEVIRIVIEVVMQVMNFPSDLIANIIAKAMQAFEMIKRDPVGFLKNLLRAIKQGFIQFFGNIGRHLLAGLQGWLMSELKDSGVAAPTDFSLRGIIGWVLQLLGITMEKIWEKLAQHPRIGPQKVARIRGMINTLEGIWTFIKDVQQRGMAAIWEKIQEKLTTLWDTILDAVKNWIMEKIVTQVTAKLLSLLDPTGIMAVINSAIAIYKAVQSFVRYLRQMLEILNSFVEGVVQIATGNIGVAANFLERSMARGVPVMIGFLANQVGLGGLGRKVGEMIGRARELVDQALTWLVNKAVDTGMALLDRLMAAGRSAVGAVTSWLGIRQAFTTDEGEGHQLYFAGNVLTVASNPTPFETFITRVVISPSDPQAGMKEHHKQNAILKARAIDELKRESAMEPNEKNRQMASLIQMLSENTKHLFGSDLPMCGEPEHNPSSDNASMFAHYMRIKPLTRRGLSVSSGSEPTDESHNIYKILSKRRRGGKTFYRKGHMLNEGLKGSGGWRNLTPLSSSANAAHESQVESLVKAAVDSGAIVEYRVVANYSARGDKLTLVAQTNDLDKKQVIEAEDKVPVSLTCEAFRLNPQLQRQESIVNKTIANDIERNIAAYDLSGVSREEIYLADKQGAQISAAFAGKLDPDYISLVVRKILQAYNRMPNGFTQYLQLFNALDFSEDLSAAITPTEKSETKNAIEQIKTSIVDGLKNDIKVKIFRRDP